MQDAAGQHGASAHDLGRETSTTKSLPPPAQQPFTLLPSPTTSESSSFSPSSSTRRLDKPKTSSTPSTSVYSTPDGPKGLVDPFSTLDVRAPVTAPLEERIPDLSPAEMVTTPSTSAGATTPASSTPSGVSSSEANDLLGPLPPNFLSAERPSLSRGGTSSPLSTSTPRLPMPSPPMNWGISELISGSPFQQHAESSYFPPMPPLPDSQAPTPQASLSRQPSSSRRNPTYSPFRSYYGDTRQAGHHRISSADLRAPPPPSPGASDAASGAEIIDGLPQRPPSDSASSPSTSSNNRRSPRVRNLGNVLAPHGSFTSVKVLTPAASSSRSSATSSDSHSLRSKGLQLKGISDDLTPAESEALTRAAAKGDQLAMYRLGWRADTPHDKRYHLGSVEDIWGSTSPLPTATHRSSRSSQGSDYFPTTNLPSPGPKAELSIASDSTSMGRDDEFQSAPSIPAPGEPPPQTASDRSETEEPSQTSVWHNSFLAVPEER